MSVRQEQENLGPTTFSNTSNISRSIPSDCMVIIGGTIPASHHSFPGMEHDRSLFDASSSSSNGGGLSQFVEQRDTNDDEREIEAAAAASEAQLKSSFVASTSVGVPTSQTLSPLHINVNEYTKPNLTSTNFRDSEQPSSNGSHGGTTARKKPYPQPTIRVAQRAPIIMGPPSNTNTQVLLSPAGNLHNGYQRMSSGDSAPSSPSLMGRNKSNSQFTNPLSFRNLPPGAQRAPNTSTSRPPSSLASPLGGSGRKDHEMTRRRALVDRIIKSRGPDYVHLLPQTEGLSHTQTSILLRKHRGTLHTEGMPFSMQTLIECSSEPDRTRETFVKRIRDLNQKRIRHNDMDELTDISDLDDDLNDEAEEHRKSPKNVPRWAPKRMRYAGLLSRAEVLLAEKQALLGMLKSQKVVLNASSGVRFAGEELIPRRRRQLNGTYFLYDKSPMRRTSVSQFGCSRAMPIQSWTRRELRKGVFEESKDERPLNNASSILKPTTNPLEKWVATSQYNIVSHLTAGGEKREFMEYDYEEYKHGEGLQRVNELSAIDPMEFVISADFTPFEDRQMTYMHRLSTAPSSTIRKKHGKAIYFETDDHGKPLEHNSSVVTKKKVDKKKERKPMEEVSSDEEELKELSKKRPRGRPATAKRKPSKMSVAAKLNNGIYLDYLFEDFMNEDICVSQLPTLVSYQSIHVPTYRTIPDDYWQDKEPTDGIVKQEEAEEKEKSSDDLLITVAKKHHKLMHAERERIKRETDKRIRNRQPAQKSAAATPAHSSSFAVPNAGEVEDDEDGNQYPPFDMNQFELDAAVVSRRRFASVEKPFEQRDFLNNHRKKSTINTELTSK
ncbi:PH domain-containing protein [Caenorhabditis elegans]|uniref:PH domain-containing protein n=1 Tax=Caenorhabditis elegans TaxID=6239 RepID=H2FLG4_CAEEL|nr:PH domain-containing protein [Caenorhabditis elegans]CCF23352.1 PH domain-containing protein [Caenorhabditis elegans]|eukprot:NP_001255076.1 Uncharacterized protein CELE_M03C11.3 [Caenorhabditis elegans]